ncbi:MAG: hypothetical protein P8X76_08360 [Maritimibacter sp.]
MTKVAIISFRRLGFARTFGFTVRDLMILRELIGMEQIERVDWFERPGLPHEYLRDLVRGIPYLGDKLRVHGGLDLGLAGALKHRRMWTHHAMKRHDYGLRDWAREAGSGGILIDFNPFYRPPGDLVDTVHSWYDLIDNFTKHNLFSEAEKAGVAEKYAFVQGHTDLITGVTDAAVAPFNGVTLANRLLPDALGEIGVTPDFDLGYLGFITDKFDLEGLREFAAQGLKILICGRAYDRAIAGQISAIPNVTYHGPFSAHEAPALIGRFKVGMVPYRRDKRHDESPIKFFQYIAHGRPAILSASFNVIEKDFPEAVHYYRHGEGGAVRQFVDEWGQGAYAERAMRLARRARNHPDLFWDHALSELLARLSD